jgi:lysozyme
VGSAERVNDERARAFLRELEALRLTAYRDSGGKLTIGYGSTRGVTVGMTITRDEAERRLTDDMAVCTRAIEKYVHVPLSDSQRATLIAFIFNVGVFEFVKSKLVRVLNLGDYLSVPTQLRRWNKVTVNGVKVVNQGLINRREKEIKVWEETIPHT